MDDEYNSQLKETKDIVNNSGLFDPPYKDISQNRIPYILKSFAKGLVDWGPFLLPIFYLVHNHNSEMSNFFSFRFFGLIIFGEIIFVILVQLINACIVVLMMPVLLPLAALEKFRIYHYINSTGLFIFSLSVPFLSWQFSVYSYTYAYFDYSFTEISIMFAQKLLDYFI